MFFPHGKNLKNKNPSKTVRRAGSEGSGKDRGSVASEGRSSSQRASRSVQEGKYKFATTLFWSTSRLFNSKIKKRIRMLHR